ncbi:hypothetical protein GCM10025794_30310 [Massilia kyonggiensis]|jgi:hypothetical protein
MYLQSRRRAVCNGAGHSIQKKEQREKPTSEELQSFDAIPYLGVLVLFLAKSRLAQTPHTTAQAPPHKKIRALDKGSHDPHNPLDSQ